MTPDRVEVPCVAGHGTVLDELRLDGAYGAHMISVHHAAGLAIAGHAHDTAKLVILLDGGATERSGRDLIEPGRCEVLVRPRWCVHANQYHAEGARSLIVELDDAPAGLAAGAVLAPAVAGLHGRRLIAAFRARRDERPRLARAAIAGALAALGEAPPPRTPAWLDRARELLFARIARPPRLVELAREVGVHPVHLAQAFRRRWGIAPLGYVRAHRVFRAIERIAQGAPLADVALEVGFADQSHMTRVIQRARRAPPGRLRRTLRAIDAAAP
ncbi:MAG TPA: AraC family transcriptional regulator [Kofleriaceae bacterium]|jgi:AraC family transcriptional regulator|nr:AraC family transcriptional regulator [Kofleriaceae bacterium]